MNGGNQSKWTPACEAALQRARVAVDDAVVVARDSERRIRLAPPAAPRRPTLLAYCPGCGRPRGLLEQRHYVACPRAKEKVAS